MREISLGKKHHAKLKAVFPEVSRQTIYASLRYFNNSELAEKIRAKAIELLEKELKEAKTLQSQ